MKKSEIRKLVKEVLTERWTDFLTQPIITSRERMFNLYTSIDKWVDDMVDPLGKYVGPRLNGFKYEKGDEIIRNVTEPYDESLMYIIMEWNEAWAKYSRITSKELIPANKAVENDFYENHANDALGYFPTEQ